jgi:hypothetical protein
MRAALAWLGMALAALGWAASQQVGSELIFDDCSHGAPGFFLLVGLGGLALAMVGGLLALPAWRQEGARRGTRFVGALGLLFAAFTGFAILLHAISGFIIPVCAA